MIFRFRISCTWCLSWFFVAVLPALATEPNPAQKLIRSAGVKIIAHRGNSSVAPENTLPAFKSAIAAGSDLVELDYHHSADGVPVVIHDEILDRTTNAEHLFGKAGLLVGDLTAARLQTLDAGRWFAEKFAGTKLPTLAQSLAVIQAGSVTLIERKGGDAATLVKLLDEAKLTDQVVVQAFNWKFIIDCRQLSPTLVLGTLSGKPPSDEQIDAAAATGADLIVWNHEKLGPAQIERIHGHGKKAWVYTVDQPSRARALLAAGIDGIITNRPAEIIRVRSASK
ncbi:MAG: glycerophosphodiester phosphodiesterase family protein [Pirellulaceae bacterium]|nr:glycerophosphodiester phosphodiesterase family protein [Pirellulaceae bacterium]